MSDSKAAAAAAAAMAAAVRDFNTELWTLYAFGVAITMLRTYARVKAVGFENLQADDFIIWLAIVRLMPFFLSEMLTNSAATLHHTVDSSVLCRQSWTGSCE